MTRTSKQIQSDIIALLEGSELADIVTGRVLRKNEYRDRDSKAEDIVVIVTASDAEQIQSGLVTINIFIPKVDSFSNGVLVEDGERAAEIELAAQRWVNGLTAGRSDYLFSLADAISTDEAPDINQNFVYIHLNFRTF